RSIGEHGGTSDHFGCRIYHFDGLRLVVDREDLAHAVVRGRRAVAVLAERERHRGGEAADGRYLERLRVDEVDLARAPGGDDELLQLGRVPHIVEADPGFVVGQVHGRHHRTWVAAAAASISGRAGVARAAAPGCSRAAAPGSGAALA